MSVHRVCTTGDGYEYYFGSRVIKSFGLLSKNFKKGAVDEDDGPYRELLSEGGLDDARMVSICLCLYKPTW